MIAFLYLSAVFGLVSGETPFETIRRVTFFVVGLAPLVFLVGLLHARLARSAVGDLIVELRADPTPADLRDALSRALRDPSLTLVYWLPEFGTYAGLDGRPAELAAEDSGRAMTLIDRDGVPVAALLHDPSLEDEPELLAAATAGAGIALENARLHVELRARLEELRGSRARMVDVANKERQRLERNLHDGAQQRLVALSLELSLLGGELAGETEAQERLTRARREIAASLAELREIARGIHPAVVSGHGLGGRARAARRARAGSGPAGGRDERAAAGGGRGRRVLPRLREPRERRQVRAGVVGDGRRQPRRTAACSSR